MTTTVSTFASTLYSITVPSSVNPSSSSNVPTSPLLVDLSQTTSSAITMDSKSSARTLGQLFFNLQSCGNICLSVQSPKTGDESYAFGVVSYDEAGSQFPVEFRQPNFTIQTLNNITISLLNIPIISFYLQFFDSSFKALPIKQALSLQYGSVITVSPDAYIQIQQSNVTVQDAYGVVEDAAKSLYTTTFTTYINSYTNSAPNCLQDSNGNYYLSMQSATSPTSSPVTLQFRTSIASIKIGIRGYPIYQSEARLLPFQIPTPPPPDCDLTRDTINLGTLTWQNATAVPPPFTTPLPACLFQNLQFGFETQELFVFYRVKAFAFDTDSGFGPNPSNDYLLDGVTITDIYGVYTGDPQSTFLMMLVDVAQNVYYFPVSTTNAS